MLGDCYSAEFFKDIKNDRIRSALTQIADETQEDLAYYEQVLKDFGCEVLRPELDRNDSIMNYINDSGKVSGRQGVPRSPLQPRDTHLVLGNNCLITDFDHPSIANALVKYSSDTVNLADYSLFPLPEFKYNEIMCLESGAWPTYQLYKDNFRNKNYFEAHVWNELQEIQYREPWHVGSATSFPVGKNLYMSSTNVPSTATSYLKESGYLDNFNVIWHEYDGHTDGNFHPIKPGAILSLRDVQTYSETFPEWDVCYLPDQSWNKGDGFLRMKDKVAGKWWVPDQEENDEFTHFVETWLNDWVGYAEETVFDVNVLALDEKHVCVSQQNNEQVNKFLKKHGMEPVYIPWRHRYFWDGGLHCITLDLYREGTQQDYFKG